ncbi:MAG: hypothetical protein WB439_09820 [Acidobacteriaceae bacterium]
MPFDLASFEAEVALKLIPTERFPATAQDAMEAGFDGPHVIRMAILEPNAAWEIDQTLPAMLADLGCQPLTLEEAALRLGCQRAEHILKTGEDPLPSLPYFHRLLWSADYPEELYELAYLEDSFDLLIQDNADEQRTLAREALENLLSPELREQRYAARRATWEQAQQRAKTEWPYVLNSPTGKALFKQRYKEKLTEMRSFLWIELVAWSFAGWAFSSWRTTVIGYLVSVALMSVLPLWGEYRRMKRERRDILLRRRVPEDQI